MTSQYLREKRQPRLWQCMHTMPKCQPVPSQATHACHSSCPALRFMTPGQGRPCATRSQRSPHESDMNENAEQRVQTATGWRTRDRAIGRGRARAPRYGMWALLRLVMNSLVCIAHLVISLSKKKEPPCSRSLASSGPTIEPFIRFLRRQALISAQY